MKLVLTEQNLRGLSASERNKIMNGWQGPEALRCANVSK